MTGKILQISVSPGGVPKYAIPEATVTPLGIQGDSWAHPHIHGGPTQALLLICFEGIQELVALGFPVFPGALGENFTTKGLDRKQMRPGQIYRTGSIMLELTKMRGPCETLGVYGTGIQDAAYDQDVEADNPATPRWGLAGFYARVIQPGIVRTDDIIRMVSERA